MTETIVLLGYDGYTSWPLACRLLNNGHHVIGVDNYTRRGLAGESVTPIADRDERVALLNQFDGNFERFRFDITEYQELKKLLGEYEPTTVYNLAQIPAAPYSMKNPISAWNTQENNIRGSLNLYWALYTLGLESHVIQLATMGEYGTPDTQIPEGFLADGRPAPKEPGSFYHACYDDQTEILTKDGWKPFSELSYEDRVMGMDSETGKTGWKSPEAIQEYDYNGDLVTVTNRSVDLAVTPNHRMFVGTSWAGGHKDTFNRRTVIEAKDLTSVPCFYTAFPEWDGVERDTFVLLGVEWSDGGNVLQKAALEIPLVPWLRFFGWWLAEGTVGKPNQTNTVKLFQNDVSELVDVFSDIGFEPRIGENGDNNNQFVQVHNKQLAEYLRQFGTQPERFIPQWIRELPSDHLDVLLEALIQGDGTRKNNGCTYFTASPKLADHVQEIALKTGRRAKISIVDRSDADNWQQLPEYRVNISGSWAVQANQSGDAFNRESYDGMVYCCTVDGGVILVRRNGKPVWCGNSKVATTVNTLFASRTWGIPTTEIYQGIVYGVHTPSTTGVDEQLVTRFDVGEAFGTVLNRFTAQSAVGMPLTVYGEGGQCRAMLPLRDCVRCLDLVRRNPPVGRVYRAVNQFAESYRVNELAELVYEETGAEIQNIENPRDEDSSNHYYDPERKELDKLGYEPSTDIRSEFQRTYSTIRGYVDRVDSSKLYPETYWDKRKALAD